VRGCAPVLFACGIRRGAEILKAAGAGRAVLLGRPYVRGLAIGAESGAREVVQNLLGDFDFTLGCSAYASVEELSPNV
jgi:lactate 2-monooxygenase